MKRTAIITTVTALAIGLTAAAATAGPFGGKDRMGMMRHGPKMSFEQLDLNSDGKVTKEEIAGQAKARFEAADADKDGFVTKAEMQAAIELRMKQRAADGTARMFERHDANNDGKLALDEMPKPKNKGKRADRFFDKMDSNDDGAISAEEFAELQKQRQGWMGGKKRHGGQGWNQ